jgi:predicted nucleic acid-binding protein
VKVISNTGPIIGLAKIDKLSLLNDLAEEILIPPLVYRELLGKYGWESSRIDRALNNFIKVTELSEISNEVKQVISALDDGEKQVVSLGSITVGEFILLLDDKAGRNAAKKLGLATTGLVGVLILAKEKGLINEVSSLLEELRIQGYWLGDSLIKIAKNLAGET